MFWLWAIASMLFQRPLVAGAVVLVVWVALDRAWFDRVRTIAWVDRRRRSARLRARLDVNPHDRDARFELAEILVQERRFNDALELIDANLRAGDKDDETLFVAGRAAFGSTASDGRERGEEYLAAARDKSPGFRSGAIEMELGRGRLLHDRPAEAEEALRASIAAQPGSVQAHVLLARALEAQGKTEEARQARREAWKQYRDSPRFKRRQDRMWAWRANPAAAARYFGALAVIVLAVVLVVPRLIPDSYSSDGEFPVQEEDGFNVDIRHAPSADRFTVEQGEPLETTDIALMRWDLDGNDVVDIRRKLYTGDGYCRVLHHYPEVARLDPASLKITDHELDQTFRFSPLGAYYDAQGDARDSALAFEALLESETPGDCDYSYADDRVTIGIHGGRPFVTNLP